MKKDQKTLLYEVLSKTAAMTGDKFMAVSESTRRKVSRGLIYEDVSLEDFDLIRDHILSETSWDHTKFTTKEEIDAEISRLELAKQRDLPSMAYENIDKHIEELRNKLMDFGDSTINEGLIKTIKNIIKRKKNQNKDPYEKEYEKEKNKEIARRNLYMREDVTFEDVCDVMLESVLDPINKIRCPEIFDKNDMMRPKVRAFINGMVDKFKEHVNFPLNIRNIYMIGSSTGYQYSLTSDIDIEIELGIEAKQKWDIIPIVPKGTFLPGTQKPLNIFILCKDESYDFDKAENVYDIINNKWLKKTDKKDLEIPYQYIRDLASFFMNGCDLSISNYEKDVRELDEYIALDPEKQEISVKEKFEAIDRKLIDVKNDVDQMKMAHHVIFAFENEGYEGNPFKISIQGIDDPDPRYSINNLVYKMLDKHGYNEKMLGIVKTGRSKIKEVEKYISENKDKSLHEARDTAPNHCRECGCPTYAGEYVCDECREKNKKKDDTPKQQPGTKVTNNRDQNPGQLQFTFDESINVKKEYDGKSLEVELDADLDLGDGKSHHIESKNLNISLTKKDGKLDLEVDIETDIKEKNDENIEKYNKKLKSDMSSAKEAGVPSDIASTLYEALAELSDKQIGALIAIENKQNLDKYCENGTKMGCPISRDIFMSIFYPGTKVHDGATIIKDGIIKYSSVFFKNISGDDFAEHYGARHRAAMGLSKETDAFCIVVSEESGNISFAIDGKLEVIKADDVKSSRDRFIKLYNENRTNKTISESINEALLLKESSNSLESYYLSKSFIKYVILKKIAGEDFISDFNINSLKNITAASLKNYDYNLEKIDADKIEPVMKDVLQDIINELEEKIKKAKISYQKLSRSTFNSKCIFKKIKSILYYNNGSDPKILVSCATVKNGYCAVGGNSGYFNYRNIIYILDVSKTNIKVLLNTDEGPSEEYIYESIKDFVEKANNKYLEFENRLSKVQIKQ